MKYLSESQKKQIILDALAKELSWKYEFILTEEGYFDYLENNMDTLEIINRLPEEYQCNSLQLTVAKLKNELKELQKELDYKQLWYSSVEERLEKLERND